MGNLPAKSAMKSNEPASSAGSRCSTAIARIRSLHRRHLRGGEALAHQRAHPGVPGRVEGEERHRPCGRWARTHSGRGRHRGVGEAVHVAEGCEHVLVSGQGPEVELLVPVDRRLGPQPGVDRVGVLVDLVGVRAVGDRSVGHPHRRRSRRPVGPRCPIHQQFRCRRSPGRECLRTACDPSRRRGVLRKSRSPAPGPPGDRRQARPRRPGGDECGPRSGRAGASHRDWS